MINEFKPDVVSISETKTNETTESYIYEIAHLGYLPMVKSRVDSEGGGSAILFKDHLRAKPIELEERFNNLEVIGGEFKVGQSTLSVFSWYVRPQEPRVSEEFLKFAEGLGDFIILGDLNAKTSALNEKTNASGVLLESNINVINAKILNTAGSPTYVRENESGRYYGSVIDLAISNFNLANKLLKYETHEISPVYNKELKYYHIPFTIALEMELRPQKERTSMHRSFLYEKTKWEELVAHIERELYDDLPGLSTKDQSDRIINSYLNAAEKFIPKTKETLKREENFPSEIKEVLISRNYWGKRFRAQRDKFSAEKYLEIGMLANNLIKEYRQTQWKEFLKRQGNNPLSSAPFWKRVNRLRACKRKRRIEALILNNIKVTKNTEKAELFAENLENKFK